MFLILFGRDGALRRHRALSARNCPMIQRAATQIAPLDAARTAQRAVPTNGCLELNFPGNYNSGLESLLKHPL
jgi:hypothetical protein